MSDLSLKLLRAYRRDPAFRREADRTIAAVEEDERASRQEAAMHLAINLNPTGAWPDPPVDGLREVVEASARESHADVVLHALHVSGGAAALASIPGATPPTTDPADKWIAWRGSASDFVTDMRRVIPPEKLALLRVLLGETDQPRPTPINAAAFVLKGPANDRVLLIYSVKPGRAWELPGGAVEPGEGPREAALRECVEEAGVIFLPDGQTWTVSEGGVSCEVVYGTSSAPGILISGSDAISAQWFERWEIGQLALSDIPSAGLIRQWGSDTPGPLRLRDLGTAK